MESQLAFANPVTTQLLMDLVFNPTAMLIPSALSASKDSSCASNVCPL
jgi:hypothetical protein